MLIEIANGIRINISSEERYLLDALAQGELTKDQLSDSEIKLINKLINKNAVQRRKAGTKVYYELRSKIAG